jgi:RNA polymerase sigma factor (sigma-70 family)
MSQDGPHGGLTSRFAASPREAGDEVFLRYARRLIGLARQQLHGPMLQKVDPEDVLQSVMRSFYARAVDGRLDLDDPESLWALLAKMTRRKCSRRIRAMHTQGRDLTREARAQGGTGDDSEGGFDVPDDEPAPPDLAVLNEMLALLYGKMQPHERPILERKLQGDSVAEIAEALQLNERKVYRVLDRVKEQLRAMQASEARES